jgi:hypothetical protein
MSNSEVERLRDHYNRLMNFAWDARGRGELDFAELLTVRASKYLDQIAKLEKQSSAQQEPRTDDAGFE